MADKVTELEERLNRLEERLKLTFVEIEKRMTQPAAAAPTFDANDRIDELEDLLLLLQLENTKLKERVGDGLDFGITPSVPDISERLNRIESEIANRPVHVMEAAETDEAPPESTDTNEIRQKLNSLEEKLNEPISEDHPVHQNLKELQKRVKTLEALLERRGREELEAEESGLLEDVRNILKG